MHFLRPEWFLLIPAFVALGFFWRSLKLHRPLRALCLLLGVLLLAQPEIRQAADGLDLWVLADRSFSAAGKIEPNLGEWQKILENSRGSNDRLIFTDFADEALLRSEGDGTSIFPGNKGATRIASAINHALSKMDRNRPARLLLLSDGQSTEPLAGVAERLVREGTALDYRLSPEDAAGDWRIQDFITQSRVRPGEAFLLSLVAKGPAGVSVPAEIYRDGVLIGKEEIVSEGGEARLRFSDRITDGGAHRYEVRLLPANDPVTGNNSAGAFVEVAGGPRVLLVTAYTGDPLAKILEAQGTEVEIISDPAEALPKRLSGAKLVVLNNVPAYKLPPAFLDSLAFYVTAQGGGLLMGGGKTSFAAGGYFGSAVDDVLPVSTEMRQEHRKLAVAMVIALDRSGSMSATVPGSNLQKMDLANAGAAQSVELLGAQDHVALYAVDTQVHEVAPLSAVGPNRDRMINAAKRVQSTGGGIYVYSTLVKAYDVLKESNLGRRHVIIFADADDATQETGDYQTILGKLRADGITVSVIGMGTAKDSGAQYLEEVAKLGDGRIFFNENPGQLVNLFSQETVAVARAAFLDKPVAPAATPGWLEITARPLNLPAQIDGYNLCYLKPKASVGAISTDEYAAPLTAFWQRGAGRSAAITFPLGGDFSQSVRAWPAYGDFLQTLSRWLEGDKLPSGAALRYSIDGSKLLVDFRHDETWNERLAKKPPRLLTAAGAAGKATEAQWEKIAPGHYHSEIELAAGESVRGVVQAGGFALPFGPAASSVNPEWIYDPARVEDLRSLAKATGGVERVDLPSVWSAPRRESWKDIGAWLLVAFFGIFVIEALQTRTGFLTGRK